MPVNTSSTGASYGKSSDPLCPLGFHPQVRWPTRCKRCFRDYKEHKDDKDREKYGNTTSSDGERNGQRPGFNKSRSLDVNIDSSRVASAARVFSRDEQDIPRPFGVAVAIAPPAAAAAAAAATGDQNRQNFGRFFEPAKARTPVVTTSTTEFLQQSVENRASSETKSLVRNSLQISSNSSMEASASAGEVRKMEVVGRSRTPNSSSLQEELSQMRQEISRLRDENDVYRREQYGNFSFESAKANETALELKKAREKVTEQERHLLELEKEKKSLNVRLKDLEAVLEKRPQVGETQKLVREMETKLRYVEQKCKKMEEENDKLQSCVQNLEGELEEVQDNFREDEADEYRSLKRELETASKNCRVLQFKLKKAEKSLSESVAEKVDLEGRLRQVSGGTGVLDNMAKIKRLEKELEQKSLLNQKYESQLAEGKKRGSLMSSRTSSVDRSVEDQLLKDLQDSIERENDLKEQMTMAEEETTDLRLRVSRLEDENEGLMQQLKKMSSKGGGAGGRRRSPSPAATTNHNDNDANSNGGGGSELDLRLQAELSEQEAAATRKRVEGLLTENMRLTKEVKDLNHQLNKSESKKKNSSGSQSSWRLSASVSENSEFEQQLEELQTELNNTRIKLIEKERECERLDAQLKRSGSGSGSGNSRSKGDESSLKKLEVIEKEAEILRQRNTYLESENERLMTNSDSKSKFGKKLMSSSPPMEKFQLDKVTLEEKIRHLEAELKEKVRVIEGLRTLDSAGAKTDSAEMTKLKREKAASDQELDKYKREAEVARREKESEIDKIGKERDKLRAECESLKSKNASNLQQTQDGIKAYKEQIEGLKKELKGKKSSPAATEQLENRIRDLEDKWAKSKRINQQRKEKIESLEKEARESEELKQEHEVIQTELSTLRQTYNRKADDWIREKLEVQKRVRELEESLRKTAGEGWEGERDRFKQIIEDRDGQITQLKIEGDVARSQASNLRKECEDVKVKLTDYEKMSKFQKVVSGDGGEELGNLRAEVDSLKKQLSSEQREKRSELNLVRMKHDSKIALMSEEMNLLKSQCSKYRRERETYKDMVEGVKHKGGSEKERIAEMQIHMQVVEDELAEAKLETSKANANAIAMQSNYEIQLSELRSKINELGEEALIESGRARIAGTRTKMELAWQKERESQKKLITELNTMARDLKSTLLEVERERERERLEFRRKLDSGKNAFEAEQEDARKQVTDLQYDLLELRDAHAKLRTTNEKLRRDKDRAEKDREDFRTMVKDRSRSEQGEDKKVSRLLSDIDNLLIVAKSSTSLSTPLAKLKESKEELEQLRRLAEEERNAKKASLLKRGGSAETDGSGDSPRTRAAAATGTNATGQQRRLGYSRNMSSDNHDMWKSMDSTNGGGGSNSSLNSIPLPVPVRTRSNNQSDSYSGDAYSSIRRLERDTSLDRMSTGSRESNRSTQSEMVSGEKRSKKGGLIGKLKKLTRGLSAEREREFGSGSDISTTSSSRRPVNSDVAVKKVPPPPPPTPPANSVAAKVRATPAANAAVGTVPKVATTVNPNEAYDKYFSGSRTSGYQRR